MYTVKNLKVPLSKLHIVLLLKDRSNVHCSLHPLPSRTVYKKMLSFLQIAGFVVGLVPLIRKLIIGDGAPLRVVQDTALLLGYTNLSYLLLPDFSFLIKPFLPLQTHSFFIFFVNTRIMEILLEAEWRYDLRVHQNHHWTL